MKHAIRSSAAFASLLLWAAAASGTCNSGIPASTPAGQFIDHGDGTVTDATTGLMWKRCAEGQSWSGGTCTGVAVGYTWQDALRHAKAVDDAGGFAGRTGWRLPNVKELRSIVEERCALPSINDGVFPNTPASYFWSASAYAVNSDGAWDVGFDNGLVGYAYKNGGSHVRLVRAGQSFDILPERTPAARLDGSSGTSGGPSPSTGAIVITHGWKADTDGWVRELARDLCTHHQLGAATILNDPAVNATTLVCQAGGWDVWIADWRDEAATMLPVSAWLSAPKHGAELAKLLRTKDYGRVHLIAHSAGSMLIDTATMRLKQLASQDGVSPPLIHATFLDGYDPAAAEIGGVQWSRYGWYADWADSYVDFRPVSFDIVPVVTHDWTRLYLARAHNVDVTPVTSDCIDSTFLSATGWLACNHSRPYRFYGLSVLSGFDAGDPNYYLDPVDSTTNMGFALTQENGLSPNVLDSRYPRGRGCHVDGSLCLPITPADMAAGAGKVVRTVAVASWSAVVETAQGAASLVDDGVTRLVRLGASALGAVGLAGTRLTVAPADGALGTDAPAWLTLQISASEPVDTLHFDWSFATAGEGFLRVFVDGNTVFELDQRHVTPSSVTTEDVFIGNDAGPLPAGTHRVSFRLDGFGTATSGVELTNVELGRSGVRSVVQSADLDGNARSEILWRNVATGVNSLWFMDGTVRTGYALALPVTPGVDWVIAGMGDFDGDGRADLVWRNTNAAAVNFGRNVVWLMNGAARTSYAELPRIADVNWKVISVADFDGDGKADIVWRNETTGQNSIWFMNGASRTSYALAPSVADADWKIAGTGDFNADGKSDFVWRNTNAASANFGRNIVWLMDGAIRTGYGEIPRIADANWAIAGVADFDGDGKADIVWRNETTGQNSIWFMNGAARTSYALAPIVQGSDWKIVATGDYNGDGKADLVWRNTNAASASFGRNTVWLMNGATRITYGELARIADANWQVIAPR